MSSNWIKHVKAVQSLEGITYKDAMKLASSSYQKGNPLPPVPPVPVVASVPNKVNNNKDLSMNIPVKKDKKSSQKQI